MIGLVCPTDTPTASLDYSWVPDIVFIDSGKVLSMTISWPDTGKYWNTM